jgi:NADPH:quinone reductase-like Zn-dependent oxidoreductase
MKSIQYNSHGSDFDSMLQLVETDDIPSNPPPGFAGVRIHAAAGNPIDVMVAKGFLNEVWKCPLPMTVGYDFSGEIVIADESSGFQVGDEVFAVNWGQVSAV